VSTDVPVPRTPLLSCPRRTPALVALTTFSFTRTSLLANNFSLPIPLDRGFGGAKMSGTRWSTGIAAGRPVKVRIPRRIEFELRFMSTVPRSSGSSVSSKSATPRPEAKPALPRRTTPCAHPRVQVVSRDEDAEYVECLECREVFDSSEFQDMAIEEKIDNETE